jgi:hypothetical protein
VPGGVERLKIEVLGQQILENKNLPTVEIPQMPPLPQLPDLEGIRDRVLKGLTTGRGSFGRTSPQYKAAAKALDRFIEETMRVQEIENE